MYALGEKRHQPYPSNSNREKRIQTQPGGTWENRLRGREREDAPLSTRLGGEPDLMEEVDAPVRKLRRKRDPSVIDQLAPYNVAEDI